MEPCRNITWNPAVGRCWHRLLHKVLTHGRWHCGNCSLRNRNGVISVAEEKLLRCDRLQSLTQTTGMWQGICTNTHAINIHMQPQIAGDTAADRDWSGYVEPFLLAAAVDAVEAVNHNCNYCSTAPAYGRHSVLTDSRRKMFYVSTSMDEDKECFSHTFMFRELSIHQRGTPGTLRSEPSPLPTWPEKQHAGNQFYSCEIFKKTFYFTQTVQMTLFD